ncbi:MAG: anti-sigma factor family protein [Acidimicrobiales bacterium]
MGHVIGCGEAVERLWEFLDQDLDGHDHQAVEEHLAFCRRCCGELEFAKELRHLLRTKPARGLPAGVRVRLDQFIAGLGPQSDPETRE